MTLWHVDFVTMASIITNQFLKVWTSAVSNLIPTKKTTLHSLRSCWSHLWNSWPCDMMTLWHWLRLVFICWCQTLFNRTLVTSAKILVSTKEITFFHLGNWILTYNIYDDLVTYPFYRPLEHIFWKILCLFEVPLIVKQNYSYITYILDRSIQDYNIFKWFKYMMTLWQKI